MQKKTSIALFAISIICFTVGILLILSASSLGYSTADAFKYRYIEILIEPSIRNYQLAGTILSITGLVTASISMIAEIKQQCICSNCKKQSEMKGNPQSNNAMLASAKKLNASFWTKLRTECLSLQETMQEKFVPTLSEVGLLHLNGNAIQIAADEDDLFCSLYPMFELSLYPCAVFSAALHSLIPNLSKDDDANLKKYILSTANEKINAGKAMNENIEQILAKRLDEYHRACSEDLAVGYSLYGYFNTGLDGITELSQDPRKKCAFLLCDHIMHIKHFKSLGNYEDLCKLAPIVEENRSETRKVFNALYNGFLNISDSIFTLLEDMLNSH